MTAEKTKAEIANDRWHNNLPNHFHNMKLEQIKRTAEALIKLIQEYKDLENGA